MQLHLTVDVEVDTTEPTSKDIEDLQDIVHDGVKDALVVWGVPSVDIGVATVKAEVR